MGNQIESSNYAAGVAIRASLQNSKPQPKKEKKNLPTFREILRSVLPPPKPTDPTDILVKIRTLSQEEAIILLQDEVRSTGDTLRQRQNPETILAYKQAVKNFIGYVAREAYTVTTKTHMRRDRNNHLQTREFTQIAVINEKLDQFATELLYDQKKQLYILERLEEIYGLIINLIT